MRWKGEEEKTVWRAECTCMHVKCIPGRYADSSEQNLEHLQRAFLYNAEAFKRLQRDRLNSWAQTSESIRRVKSYIARGTFPHLSSAVIGREPLLDFTTVFRLEMERGRPPRHNTLFAENAEC